MIIKKSVIKYKVHMPQTPSRPPRSDPPRKVGQKFSDRVITGMPRQQAESHANIDLLEAARGKYKVVYGVRPPKEFLSDIVGSAIYSDCFAQLANAIELVESANIAHQPTVVVDMNNFILRMLNQYNLEDDTYMSLAPKIYNFCCWYARRYPEVHFVLVGTNRAEQSTLNRVDNITSLHLACLDPEFGLICKLVHGFAEIDDFFSIVLSAGLNKAGVTVGILSHDHYSWWKDPRLSAHIEADGTLHFDTRYDPSVWEKISNLIISAGGYVAFEGSCTIKTEDLGMDIDIDIDIDDATTVDDWDDVAPMELL